MNQRRSHETSDEADGLSLTRRTAVGGFAGSILAAAGMVAAGNPVFAQDATPQASPVATGEEEEALPRIPPEIEQYINDWPMAQQGYDSTRNGIGSTIDSSNVDQLGVAWELPLNASSPYGAITSNPIVLGETVYLIDNEARISSINRATGELNWESVNNVGTFGPNGVAVGYGYLIGVLGDTAEVLALDAETGEERWRFQLANHNSLGITMAPFVFDGYVLVSTEPGGNSKGNYQGGANGVVYCLDIQTGLTLWTWDTVQDDLWGNFRVNSGGGLWYPPAVDVETGVLYMGIGNAGPFIYSEDNVNAESRPGANDYANCLVALDPAQGKVLWYINVKPHDLYDHDNQQTPMLATVKIGESDAEVVYTSGKHGYVVAAHRSSGQEIWRTPVGLHQNDGLQELPLGEENAVEVFPGLMGGVESPMAFKDGVVYVANFNYSITMAGDTFIYDPERGFEDATTNLVAINGSNGQIIWDVTLPTGIAGPGPTIAGDLLFTGSLDGIVRAFSLADGTQVWSAQTAAGLNAPFAVAGDQLFVPTGTFITPSVDSPETVPNYYPALIAFQIGAEGTVTEGEAMATGDTGDVAEGTILVNAEDIAFDVNEITIPADTDTTIRLTNTGVLQHDLVIENTDFGTELLDSGESAEIVVNLPAGEYTYYCSVSGHREAGMAGKLIVG